MLRTTGETPVVRNRRLSLGMPDVTIRLATEADLPAINSIYNTFVGFCSSAFHDEAVSDADRLKWFKQHDAQHPIMVADVAGQIAGFSALSHFDERPIYRHTVLDTLYVHPSYQGQGIGKALMIDLLDRAKQLGHQHVIATISAGQGGLREAHRRAGFREIGTFPAIATRFGRKMDMVYMQLDL